MFNPKSKYNNITSAYLAMAFLIMMIIIGVSGYVFIEGYSFSDALFMTIITISTVGFREVQPLTEPGKIFTIFLIIFSFGIFAYAVSTFTRYVVDGVFHNFFKINKVRRKIDKVKDHVVICGYGRNGKQAAMELLDHNVPVVIIENKDEEIEKIIEDNRLLFIQGDATRDEVLLSAHIDKAKALITTLPNDADNLFVVLSTKEVNPNLKIISRASDDNSDIKLKRAGATNVIMPDKIGGQRMAKLVARPNIIEFVEFIVLQRSKDVYLEEISCEKMADCFVNKSIRELDVRNVSGANIVGLRNKIGEYIINPSPEVVVTPKDTLFVLGNSDQITKLSETLKKNK
ncbi:MAG TPA: potassium channel protein [Bacteroidales bacterium]|nr:MAG: hypothetical protein A2W98_10460 [Bacteroidetes bacterium GWF2_33_38]OFY73552.1 MAG: hypothetical protein A2265_00635 [Bacteroidetes bacterium RIFOXYA12_FULL_33_9]OFY87084.1 MAG: hypothetical protein A2236_02845 [Bacteroidetes bacterium RIFOXYA2_FULL_33_7]HBF87892.1 potassium channel protein [Bacteroidales bacterium]